MKKWLTIVPIALCLITLLAGILRIYKLDTYPTGFHIDEASLGYNGYSMLKTGKDEHGNRFPLYIDMFGDNRPSGYHYLTILPIAVFGLNEFATRLPGALFGTISVIALYYLVYSLFKDKKLALISSLLLAISPWHIVSSRASAESVVALFFILLGFGLVIRSLFDQKIRLLTLGSIFLVLSYFFYHTPRVFVPLLLLCMGLMLISRRNTFSLKFRLTGIAYGLVIALISILLIFVIKGGTGRYSQVSIFGSPATTLILEEQLREDGTRHTLPVVTRIFHNKIVNYAYTVVSNYFQYFNGEFLFMSGGRPLWYKVPSVGMVYLAELPFIVIGLIYLFIQKNNLLKIILVWLFIAPVVASLTTDDIPNIQRSMVMFSMFEVLAAYGVLKIYSISSVKVRNVSIAFIAMVLFLNFGYFWHQYTVQASAHETEYRFNGFKEMVLAVKDVVGRYDYIILTKTSGGIYPHVLFFMQYDPATYQKEGSPKDPDYGGFGKFLFSPQFCPSINGDDRFPKTGRILYVDSGTCNIPSQMSQQKIFREDGTVAFILVYGPK